MNDTFELSEDTIRLASDLAAKAFLTEENKKGGDSHHAQFLEGFVYGYTRAHITIMRRFNKYLEHPMTDMDMQKDIKEFFEQTYKVKTNTDEE